MNGCCGDALLGGFGNAVEVFAMPVVVVPLGRFSRESIQKNIIISLQYKTLKLRKKCIYFKILIKNNSRVLPCVPIHNPRPLIAFNFSSALGFSACHRGAADWEGDE